MSRFVNYCIDCGKEITRYAKRCKSCANKGDLNPRGMLGKHCSEETKEKMRKKLRGVNKGKNNAMYGNHKSWGRHSESTKRLMSEKKKGLNNNMFGKHHSEETKLKISLSVKKGLKNRINNASNVSMGERICIKALNINFPCANFHKEMITCQTINVIPDSISHILRVVFEYDGLQHFKEIKYFHGHCLKQQRKRDKLLEEWCFEKGYRIIRLEDDLFNRDKEKMLKVLVNEVENGFVPIVKFGMNYCLQSINIGGI